MTGWFFATMGTAALGSVFPVVNIELYLIGVLSTVQGLSWWMLALAATIGQLTGKTLVYFAGKGSFTLGRRLGKATEGTRNGRWATWLERFHDTTERRPWWGLGVLLISAVLSFPPYTLLCFVSGAAGIPTLGFLVVSFIGRATHFLLIAAAPELAQGLLSAIW